MMQALRGWVGIHITGLSLWTTLWVVAFIVFTILIVTQSSPFNKPDHSGQCIESIVVKSWKVEIAHLYSEKADKAFVSGGDILIYSGYNRVYDTTYVPLETDTTWTDCDNLTQRMWDLRAR